MNKLLGILLLTLNCNLQGSELNCLAEVIYMEARSEELAGMAAVGLTVRNRVESEEFPNTYCKVVYQYNQFSYLWDQSQKYKVSKKSKAYKDSLSIAGHVLRGDIIGIDGFEFKYTYYHRTKRKNSRMNESIIGGHVFGYDWR